MAHQKFTVGAKAFIVRKDELLLVHDHKYDAWEVPGGRIEEGEENLPLQEVLVRELQEELPGTMVNIGDPVQTWVRQKRSGKFVFLVGYLCEYVSGDIVLSDEHDDFQWVTKDSWKELDIRDNYTDVLGSFWEKYRGLE